MERIKFSEIMQVCIELKRDFDSGKYNTLVGQIEVYSTSNFSAMIGIICPLKEKRKYGLEEGKLGERASQAN